MYYAEWSMMMKMIKDGKIQDPSYLYCPDWTAPNKSRRPKKQEGHKSGLKTAMAAKKGNRKKTLKWCRCHFCGKWNHQTKGCFILTRQQTKDPDEMHIDQTGTEATDDASVIGSVYNASLHDGFLEGGFLEGTAE